MDEIQKSRIRLKHWVDHNEDHLKGYEDVAQLLETQGLSEAASRIRQGIDMTRKANDEFRAALSFFPAETASSEHSHDDHHSHDHGHHCGLHKHEHEHSHSHGGSHKDHK
jgi:hypothetical protein